MLVLGARRNNKKTAYDKSGLLLLSEGNWVHVQITATMSLAYTATFASIKPMKDNMDNIFQIISLLATFVNLTLAVISLSGTETDKGEEALRSMFFITANVILLAIVGCEYLWSLYQNFKVWLKTPRFSLDCCVAFLLSILQFVGDFLGASSGDVIKEQALVGDVEAPTIENQVNSQITFEVDDGLIEEQEELNKDGTEGKEKDYEMIKVSSLMRARVWLQNIAIKRKKVVKSSESQLETRRFEHALDQSVKKQEPSLIEIEKEKNRRTQLMVESL